MNKRIRKKIAKRQQQSQCGLTLDEAIQTVAENLPKLLEAFNAQVNRWHASMVALFIKRALFRHEERRRQLAVPALPAPVCSVCHGTGYLGLGRSNTDDTGHAWFRCVAPCLCQFEGEQYESGIC